MRICLSEFPRTWTIVLVLYCVASCVPLQAIDKKKEAEALALLQKAHGLTDIRAEGSTPFRLEADFKFYGLAGGTTAGKYAMIWASPDQWREEISFPGFSQVRVGGKDRVWMYRNIQFRPLRVSQLYAALDVAESSALESDEKAKAFRQEKVNGELLDCVKTQTGDWPRKLCFDPGKGVLARESQANVTAEFENYTGFGSKLFPRTIRVLEDDEPAIAAEVTARATTEKPDAAMFVPPDGSLEWMTCVDPQPPKPIAEPEPPYPQSAKKRSVGGVEVAYIFIDVNGDIQHAAILKSIGPEFDETTLKTLQRAWKFKPATCNGVPVPIEVNVVVKFRLLR